jgi:hypothetical protein
MRSILIFPALLSALTAAAAAQATDADIYVAPLRGSQNALTLGELRNITNRVGYDNQPHFTRDGRAILYTARIADTQTDIFRYDLAAQRATQVTRTTESEYSPTPLPDGGFSVIRVERDSTQRLWRFDAQGAHPSVLMANIKPVGYHAWIDDQTIAMFVLGRPATLRIGDVRAGTADSVAANIGRAIQRLPNAAAVSFVQFGEDSTRSLWRVERSGRPPASVGQLPRGGEYHAWTPGGALLATAGSQVFEWNASTGAWRVVADYASRGLRVSRIAISPAGDWIALVGERAAR